MLTQLIIGGATILLNMGVMVGIVALAMNVLRKMGHPFGASASGRFFAAFSGAVLFVVLANTLCIWIWAILFLGLNVFSQIEESLYFSITSYTTVGYGDIVVGREWRLLAGFISVNGLLAFGVATAFLFEVMRQTSGRRRNNEHS